MASEALAARPDLRLAAPVGVAAVAALTCVAVNLADPNEAGHYPTCPFLALTGRQCPGCGTLRAIRALTRGDLLLAIDLNVLTVLLLPLLVWGWATWTRGRLRGGTGPVPIPPVLGTVIAVAVPVFFVARNLPWLSALAA